MSEEVIVKGFLNEDTLSAGCISKSNYGDREHIELNINLDGKDNLYFSKEVNPQVKDDMPEVIGLLQLLDMFVKEVQKAENPEPEITEGEIVEDAANEMAVASEAKAAATGSVKGV